MTLKDLAPPPDQRLMLIGTTGCGKTTVARHLLSAYPHVVAIDSKMTLGSGKRLGDPLLGFVLARNPRELVRLGRKNRWVQYRPDIQYQEPEVWSDIYDWIYQRGETMVYSDEAFDTMTPAGLATPGMRRCITSGRELGIGMITATQRPRRIDPRLLSETEHWMVFHLRHPADRLFLRDRIGEGPLPDHGFWWSVDRPPYAPPKALRLSL